MKQRIMNLLFGLGFFLSLLILIASTARSAQAENSYQNSQCEELIADAANRASIISDEIEWTPFPDETDPWAHCSASYAWHPDERETQYANFLISRNDRVGLGDRPTCGTQVVCEETTFHGFPAMYYSMYSQGGWFAFVWRVERNGFTYVLDVDRGGTIYGSPADVFVDKGEVMALAEALWSAFDSALPSHSQDSVAPNPGDQPGGDAPTFQGDPTSSDQPASLGPLATTPFVPLVGALIGTAVGWLVSVAATSGNVLKTLVTPPLKTAQPPAIPTGLETGKANDQGLYWSERPWDEAGPGYVSKEEYERTNDMLAQGYKWTNGGWQTPDEIRHADQWQQNNRDAVTREDAAWQVERESERQALEQNKDELKKTANELQAAGNMLDLKDGLETINQELLNENIYVLNPLQGDPTLIFDGLSKVGNMGWDLTTGWVTPSNGMTCGDYVGETLGKVKKIIGDQYGPTAKVEGIIFEEK